VPKTTALFVGASWKKSFLPSANEILILSEEIYLSFDIEADGPTPGLYSMLSIGMCVAGRTLNGIYKEQDPEAEKIYLELKPISENHLEVAMLINKLDRDRLALHGLAPEQAMRQLSYWILSVSDGFNPVLVAYPSTFDWPFLSYYFCRFLDGPPPVAFTRVCDIRTMLVVKSGSLFYTPTDQCVPAELLPKKANTHHALKDAVEQAHLFSAIHMWAGKY
jgi:hypothetical protein